MALTSAAIDAAIFGGTTAIVGFGGFAAFRYKISSPSEYIVKTGLGISEISIRKKTMVWPFQRYRKMSIAPITFPIEVDAMSEQRIPFRMPSVWTIGPKNEMEPLENYAKLLIDKGSDGMQETVEGVIQGETRVLTANLDLNVLFSDREKFKNEVVVRINDVLGPFGLVVYNANIAELADLDHENKYFAEQKKRALQKVNQEARVSVAEAMKDGETGEREHQTQTRIKVAWLDREATVAENERRREINQSNKDLSVANAEYGREQNIAEIQANAAAQKRRAELLREVEEMRRAQEIERKRADEFSVATVNAEVEIKRAEGAAAAMRIRAEANLYAKQREADGILAVKTAEAESLQKLVDSAGSTDNLNRYLMIQTGMLPNLAREQALAIQGMKPKVTVWSTGQANDTFSKAVTDLFKTGMPLFDGIKEQTGYDFLKTFKDTPIGDAHNKKHVEEHVEEHVD